MPQHACREDRPRQILHVNTDDFFASLARRRDPSLRTRPVVVGNLMNRGSVVSASYEARRSGVHPGLTMQQAARRAPDAVLVQIDWAFARRASGELVRVLERYAPRVETSSLDEAFVDYTGCGRLLGTPLDAGRRLQGEVRDRVGLDVSIGVAANKLVSRFASSAAKRYNLVDVRPGCEASFLAPQPVERLPSVGALLGRRLREMGIPTVGELALVPAAVLEGVFGAEGRRLAEEACGIDRSPVSPVPARSCLEECETFEPDLLRWDALEAALDGLCARLGTELRLRGASTRRVVVELEHSDRVRVRRQAALAATHLDARLAAAARQALVAAYTRRVRVRRLAVQAWELGPAALQLDLFAPDVDARLHRLVQATDRLRARYGDARLLVRGRALLGTTVPDLAQPTQRDAGKASPATASRSAGKPRLPGRATGGAASTLLATLFLAVPSLSSDRAASPPSGGPPPGWVLHETHATSEQAARDTLRIYITPSRVRVSHAAGDAILNIETQRLELLDPAGRTYREVSLSEWEARIREAVEEGRERAPGEPEPRFEPSGQELEVAGYRCQHYALYARRELLPGQEEFMEQQIWVTRDLELPGKAYEAYQDVLGSLESVGLGGLARRPPGVLLAAEARTRRALSGPTDVELVERSAVFRVERIPLPDSVFSIPGGYAPATRAGG